MAVYSTDHVEQNLTNDLIGVNIQLDDQDVPLLTDSDSEHCKFHHLIMPDSGQNAKDKRQLMLATSLCFAFMIAEIIGGYVAGSLSIITDAAHLFSDCISFIVAIIAIYLSKKRPDNRMSFGYKRAEVLGAILSILGIWILTLGLLVLATNRLFTMDFDIDANIMMTVSALGVFINIIMALILHGDGFCVGRHNHSHAHGTKHEKLPSDRFRNNNRGTTGSDLRHKILQNINADDGLAQPLLLNSRNRSNSTCSYRSPSHSRTNSFSRTLPFNGGDSTRRTSHSNVVKMKNIMTATHCDSIDSGIARELMEPKHASKILIDSHANNMSVTDASICPTHNYIQREDIDNTSECSVDDPQYRHLHTHHVNNNNLGTRSINIRAAVIHVIGDFIQSIGVFTSAVIIKFFPEAKAADPICTFLFSIIVIFTTVGLMKDSIMIILEAVPNTVDLSSLAEELSCMTGVRSVHHLNVWSLTVGWNVMSVHIVIDSYASVEETLIAATTLAQQGFDIKHSTIQIETALLPDISPDII